VDSLTRVRLLRDFIDIDSTTGREGRAGEWLAAHLERLGYNVVRQVVAEGVDGVPRVNVIASRRDPVVTFSTHFDCVPPFIPSREADGRVYGRGACDAKGILIAQIAAAERLHEAGEDRVGLVFVVAEERGSEGARAANTLARGSRFLINGEPTDNRLGRATRGVYRVKLHATGRAAHSSLPHLGESAIDKLLDALVELRRVVWPVDPDLGAAFYSVGVMSGGVAPNVISPHAEAEVMFRTTTGPEPLRALMEKHLGALVALEDVLVVPPVRLLTVPGYDTEVFAFTTDIPWLDRWGTPLLVGPGSITVAHTVDEHLEIAELDRAVDLYADLARTLLSRAG
jgi:acetylornithine deacetylase